MAKVILRPSDVGGTPLHLCSERGVPSRVLLRGSRRRKSGKPGRQDDLPDEPIPNDGDDDQTRSTMPLDLSGRLHSWIRASTTRSAALQLGGGTAVAQGLAVLTAPLLTRLYAPAAMGQFGLLVSFVAFASVGLSLRYDMAIVPAPTEEEADRLLVVAVALAIPMSATATLLLVMLVRGDFLSFGSLPLSSIGVTFLLLLTTGIFGAVRYWAIRQQDFGPLARASMAQGTGRAVVPLIAAVLGAGWWGLMLGEIAGRVLGIGPIVRTATRRMRKVMQHTAWRAYRASASANWRYPTIVAPSAFLDALGAALALPIVADNFGTAAAGQLFIVQRLASVPAALVGASVADVFHAKVSAIFRDNPSEVKSAVLATVKSLAVIASAIYVPLGIASYWGFGLVFGGDWKGAGLMVALFTPLSIATLAVSPVTRLYFVLNRPELKLIFDVGLIAVPTIAFSVLHRLGAGFWACMAAYVALGTVAYMLHLVLTLWAAGLPPRARAGEKVSAVEIADDV